MIYSSYITVLHINGKCCIAETVESTTGRLATDRSEVTRFDTDEFDLRELEWRGLG